MTLQLAMDNGAKICRAIEGKLPKYAGFVRAIALPEFQYVEFVFTEAKTNNEVTLAYNWQIFAAEKTDLNTKAKRVFADLKAILGVDST